MSSQIIEKCSLFKSYLHREHGWCFSTKPQTVNIIDVLTKPLQPELLAAVRNEPVKDKRDPIKKQLWGITPSSIQEGGRGIQYVKNHTGLIAFDIDKHNGLPIRAEQLNDLFKYIISIPYTLYCGKSASGLGLWGLFRISEPDKHAQHFDAMSDAFEAVGITIDQYPRSAASLRFISYDQDAFINDYPKVFDKLKVPVIKHNTTLKAESSSNGNNTDAKELIRKFNAECSTQDIYTILENFGFQYHSISGKRIRFTRPGKDTKAGLSIDYHEDKRTLYSFSSETPLIDKWKAEHNSGWSCSPMTALLLYGFGGTDKKHWAQAFNYLKSKM